MIGVHVSKSTWTCDCAKARILGESTQGWFHLWNVGYACCICAGKFTFRIPVPANHCIFLPAKLTTSFTMTMRRIYINQGSARQASTDCLCDMLRGHSLDIAIFCQLIKWYNLLPTSGRWSDPSLKWAAEKPLLRTMICFYMFLVWVQIHSVGSGFILRFKVLGHLDWNVAFLLGAISPLTWSSCLLELSRYYVLVFNTLEPRNPLYFYR